MDGGALRRRTISLLMGALQRRREPADEATLAAATGLGAGGARGAPAVAGWMRELELAGAVVRRPTGWELLRGAREVTLDLDALESVRAALGPALANPRKRGPRGWSKSKIPLEAAVGLVPTLSLRPGHRLIAYQHRDGEEGQGVVWAVPESAGHPEPRGLPTVDRGGLAAPRPPEAADDPIAALELDGTPLAHAHAWLLRRELAEAGASGAAVDWSFHTLVDRLPWEMPEQPWPEASPAADWTFPAGAPTELAPTVSLSGSGRATITVWTWTALGGERLIRHVTVHHADGTRASHRAEIVGTGGPGVVI